MIVLLLWACVSGRGAGTGSAAGGGAADGGAADGGGGTLDGGTADGGVTDGGTADGGAEAPWAAPTALADRLGIYAWGADTTAMVGDDPLLWLADQAAALGSRTLRVALSTRDDYGVNPDGAGTLAEIASGHSYTTLFDDPRFDTVMLTTYSADDLAGQWTDGLDSVEAARLTQEITDLATMLATGWPSKTFVILPWEGDNAIQPWRDDDVAWQGYADWIAARQAAVRAARVATGSDRVFCGLEFNRVQGCGDGPERCVINVVAPAVAVDFLSYSAWSSLAQADDADVVPTLRADLDSALAWTRSGQPAVGPERFLVGEFGFARDLPWNGECTAARRTMETAAAVLDWGATWGVFWQVVDNTPPASTSWVGFGLQRYDGSRTLAGDAYAASLAADLLSTPDDDDCPSINADGVVDGVTWDDDVVPGDVISIFGHRYSKSGNRVELVQGPTRVQVTAGSDAWWESEDQINARLPPEITADDWVVVTVIDAGGRESNGFALTVKAE